MSGPQGIFETYIGNGALCAIALLTIVGMTCIIIDIYKDFWTYHKQALKKFMTKPKKISIEEELYEPEEDCSDLTIRNEWSEQLMDFDNNFLYPSH